MKIIAAGCSGLIGTELITQLEARGDEVIQLVRRTPDSDSERKWNPQSGELDPAYVEGADTVICLSGTGVADKRWTASVRKDIVSSRVDSVDTLAKTITSCANPPKTLLSASAVGYYGSSLSDDEKDETSMAGSDFLADVCKQWEAAAEPAHDVARCVQTRIGVVLTTQGGALAKMLPPFKLGVGGPLSSGKQIMSWISLSDVVNAMIHNIDNDSVSGPVNLTAPHPLSNVEFSRSLAHALGRPCIFRVPAVVIRMALGEMGETLMLKGAHVNPTRLLNSGFRFQHATIHEVWESEFS